LGLGLIAQTIDLVVTNLVAAGLARPRAIAVDFRRDFERVGAVAFDEEIDRLLPRPALGVKAAVDHQPARAEGDRLEVTEAPDREIVIDAELVDQLLGI